MEAAASSVKDGGDLRDTELRLGLPGTEAPEKPAAPSTRGSKRALQEDDDMESRANSRPLEADSGEAPAAKAQIVGWPPIRSYRRNSFPPRKVESEAEAEAEAEAAGLYVKVSMDGAPYLRKIDLKVYKGYKELREAMDNMFKCFTQGEVSRKEGCSSGSESAITYEDKDGDLMLVGDVPWEMFISSCRRLRIMKGCEVRGLRTRQYS
ncbi:Auxin-induced protein 22D [Musa troglodytarum]|uniref:Auxin-responsive protein n=1 Tax=Musa troglodytarum TaxID=320322 RepID=A0A9E7JQS5_9LILI|nr:Auxin-induced protein 22D [Musa troglodytarum]